jgi:hypothetical protein
MEHSLFSIILLSHAAHLAITPMNIGSMPNGKGLLHAKKNSRGSKSSFLSRKIHKKWGLNSKV